MSLLFYKFKPFDTFSIGYQRVRAKCHFLLVAQGLNGIFSGSTPSWQNSRENTNHRGQQGYVLIMTGPLSAKPGVTDTMCNYT
jgi:hypothetical protein